MKTTFTKTTRTIMWTLTVLLCALSVKSFACTASFTWAQTAPNTITFTSTSTGVLSGDVLRWDLGDMCISSVYGPTVVVHSYDVPGTHYVQLYVQDAITHAVHCFTNPQPVIVTGTVICNIAFDAYPTQAASCSTCADGAAESGACGGQQPYTYLWSNGATTQHITGVLPGAYGVCVTDANGCSACDSVIVDSTSCSAAFMWSQTSSGVISFTDMSAGVPTSWPSYYWDFGDGNYAYTQNPSHGYSSPGTYYVCYTLRDSSHCYSTFCDSVVVTSQGCSANFYVYPSGPPHNYYAVNLAAGTPPITYLWSWGDGNYDTSPYPTHVYASPGFYQICLTITDASSCTSTMCDSSNVMIAHNEDRSDVAVTINVIPPTSVGISKLLEKEDFSVFPNPFNSTISIIAAGNKNLLAYRICSLQGAEILSGRIKGQEYKLNLEALSAGIYLLEITSESGLKTYRKLIKE